MVSLGDTGERLSCEIRGCSEEAAGWAETNDLPPRPAMIDLCERHFDLIGGRDSGIQGDSFDPIILVYSNDGYSFVRMWSGTVVP